MIGSYVSVSQKSQELTVILIDHRQYLNGSPIIEPQPAPLMLFLWNLQPLLTPDALYPLVIDPPVLPSQKGRDPTITVVTISTGQPDNVGC